MTARGGEPEGTGRLAVLSTVLTIAAYSTTLLQQVIYARVLGVNTATDSLGLSLAWSTGIAGAVGTTFASVMVPMYLRALREDPEVAAQSFRTASAIALGFGLGGAAITLVLADSLAVAMLPGAAQTGRLELAALLRLGAPLTPIWILASIGIALANAHRRFLAAAASAIAPSLVIVLALLIPKPVTTDGVMLAYLAAAMVQVATLLIAVRSWARSLLPSLSWGLFRPVRAMLLPVGIALALMNSASIAARTLGSLGGPGDAAVVDYATRLIAAAESALLSGALAIALTAWSVGFAVSDGRAREGVDRTLRVAVGLFIPAAALLAILAPDIVNVLFGGGKFGPAESQVTASFLQWMAPGVAAHSFLMVAVRAQLALGSGWPIAIMALTQLSVLIAVGLVAQPLLGVVGIALAFSVSWLVAVVVTIVALRPELRSLSRQVASALIGTVVAAGSTGLVLSTSRPPSGWILAVGAISFLAVGFAVGSILRLEAVEAMRVELSGLARKRTI